MVTRVQLLSIPLRWSRPFPVICARATNGVCASFSVSRSSTTVSTVVTTGGGAGETRRRSALRGVVVDNSSLLPGSLPHFKKISPTPSLRVMDACSPSRQNNEPQRLQDALLLHLWFQYMMSEKHLFGVRITKKTTLHQRWSYWTCFDPRLRGNLGHTIKRFSCAAFGKSLSWSCGTKNQGEPH